MTELSRMPIGSLLASLMISFLLFSGSCPAFDHWPDTGQDLCYTNEANRVVPCSNTGNFDGQDAQYDGMPRVYTKLDGHGNPLPDGATSWVMVRDEGTGLIWEVKTTTNRQDRYTWNEALDYAAHLTLGDYNDWRLPTAKELASLVDAGTTRPAINTDYFPNTMEEDALDNNGTPNDPCDDTISRTSYYWSSTEDSDPAYAWYIRFKLGNIYNGERTDQCSGALNRTKNSSFHVRAVRGREPDHSMLTGPRFEDLGNLIRDHATGLEWQKGLADADLDNSGNTTWQEALEYCETLDLAGGGWRLPDRNELLSLIDYSTSRYATVFPGVFPVLGPATVDANYWSSSSNAFGPSNDHAWYVDFVYGGMFSRSKEHAAPYYVRAVRGREVTLRLTVKGPGKVSSQPAGIEACGGPDICTATLRQGAVLTAVPSSRFIGWSGGGCFGNTNTCVVLADEDGISEVTALFRFPWVEFIPATTGAGHAK